MPKNHSITPLVWGERTRVRTWRSSGSSPVNSAANARLRKAGAVVGDECSRRWILSDYGVGVGVVDHVHHASVVAGVANPEDPLGSSDRQADAGHGSGAGAGTVCGRLGDRAGGSGGAGSCAAERAITDVGLRAAFDQGLPIVEAVRSYSHRDTTGVIYHVVRDPAQLTSPTAKFVVATGRPPAEEFLATTNLAGFGAMQQLVDHYAPRVYYPGHFVAAPPIQLPGAYSAAGIAFITL